MMDKLVCIQDFEERAGGLLDQNAINYYQSGSEAEITLRENSKAFSRWQIRPRVLRDASTRNLNTVVLGKPISFPIGVAPTAHQSLIQPEGEILNAKAAASTGTIFVLSILSNCSLEDVAEQAPGGRKWFQIFPNFKKSVIAELIRRAEVAGYEAIVVTVDAQCNGRKWKIMRNSFTLPQGLGLPNLESVSLPPDATVQSNGSKSLEQIAKMINNLTDDTLNSWDTIDWISSITKLPIVLKGILTPEDAQLAVEHKVKAVWVSNHGGRQIDTTIPTIDVLPDIVNIVRNQCEIYMDSGIRKGSDVFKALALGATMVFVGRPVVWGLAVGGETGARAVLNILKDELSNTMGLSGVTDIKDINSNYVQRRIR